MLFEAIHLVKVLVDITRVCPGQWSPYTGHMLAKRLCRYVGHPCPEV